MIDIKALLERYYNGETSLEEEEILEAYWEKGEGLDEEASARLFAAKKQYREEKPLSVEKERSPSRRRYILFWPLPIAATLVLCWFLGKQYQASLDRPSPGAISARLIVNEQVSGEIQDEKLALEQARKVLAYVGEQLNRGSAGVAQIEKLNYPSKALKNE